MDGFIFIPSSSRRFMKTSLHDSVRDGDGGEGAEPHLFEETTPSGIIDELALTKTKVLLVV